MAGTAAAEGGSRRHPGSFEERAMMNVSESGCFPCVGLGYETDDDLVDGLIANDPVAWRVFKERFDRLILRCVTKVTRRFSSLVSADDVADIYASLYVSLVANDM